MSSTQAFSAFKNGEFASAFSFWLPLANGGDAESQAWLGTLYENGHGVGLDYALAFAVPGNRPAYGREGSAELDHAVAFVSL